MFNSWDELFFHCYRTVCSDLTGQCSVVMTQQMESQSNSLAAESFSLAQKRLAKKKKNPNTKQKGGQQTFAKRKKNITKLLKKIEE